MTSFLRWDELLSTRAPWSFFVAGRERDLDSFVLGKPNYPGLIVRLIRGRRCSTRDQFFQEWAAAFQFPHYFGHNWDAFEECINDLEWLPGKAYVTFLSDVGDVLNHETDDFRVLIDTLMMAAQEWRSPERHQSPHQEVPFRVVFHCSAEEQGPCQKRLELAGSGAELRLLIRAPGDFDEPEE
jgi:RNAse (barnase) inhibitor barstar